ncbi:ATP-binding cassette, subfamily B [Arboricoccus pini]|uniref:ATP-binding cassette, subfamily B n=1 Tax=Arboricoccus pini TaxID=1963835 RepID=A0A212R795_9PROT|nr:ABC transporter transmembrane domain-containing protein [Arboricoccus pini]SNB67958.1 ATP-binding cassette, subfamily B [Arboricoccus pini]
MASGRRTAQVVGDGREKSRNLKPLKRLARYLLPYRWRLVLALLALVLAAGSVLSLGVGMRYLIDHGLVGGRLIAMRHAVEAVLIVIVVLALSTFTRSYLVTWLGERVVADLRTSLERRLIRLEPGFFETRRMGEIISRLTTDTSVIQAVIASSVTQALRNLLMLVGGLVLLAVTNPKLTGLILLVVPLVVVPIVVIGRNVRRLSRQTQDRVATVSALAEETLGAVKTVQAFGQEEHESRRFAEACETAFAAASRYAWARAFLAAIVITLVIGAIVVVLWIGGQDVVSGRLTAGELASFVFFASVVAGAMGGLSDTFGDLQRAAGAAERIFELMDIKPKIAAPPIVATLPPRTQGEIEFNRVSFAYPSAPERLVLDHFDLRVRPGETVAIVGPSGAGKSTIFDLLMRFYDPQEGRVFLDGQDLRSLAPEMFRRRLALVSQDPVLFGTDVLTNIRYGLAEADEAAVVTATRNAAAQGFVERLPQGYKTFLGERGVRLSGGQRQRIAIARAILREPSVLLLDEATSALDAESERAVQEALERLRHGRTCLVIAHRLATVRKADRIVVLDQGRVIDEGRHEELVARGGLYARLAALQFDLEAAA